MRFDRVFQPHLLSFAFLVWTSSPGVSQQQTAVLSNRTTAFAEMFAVACLGSFPSVSDLEQRLKPYSAKRLPNSEFDAFLRLPWKNGVGWRVTSDSVNYRVYWSEGLEPKSAPTRGFTNKSCAVELSSSGDDADMHSAYGKIIRETASNGALYNGQPFFQSDSSEGLGTHYESWLNGGLWGGVYNFQKRNTPGGGADYRLENTAPIDWSQYQDSH